MNLTKLEQLKYRFNEVSKRMDVSLPADRFILSLELEELKDQIKEQLELELESKTSKDKCQKPKSKKSVE